MFRLIGVFLAIAAITIGVVNAKPLRESVYQKEKICYLCETFNDLSFDEKSALEAAKKNGVHIMGVDIKGDKNQIIRDKKLLRELKFNVLNVGGVLLKFKGEAKEGLVVGSFVMTTYRETNKTNIRAEQRQNEICENGMCYSINVQIPHLEGNIKIDDVVNKFKQNPISLIPIKIKTEGTYVVDVYYKIN